MEKFNGDVPYPKCLTCNGWGEVGSLQTYGYDGDICPVCCGSGLAKS